jgi:tape measure domain-containing protein
VSTEIYAIKIQQTGAEKVAKAYDGMAQSAERTNRKIKEVADTSKKSATIMAQFRSALVALSAVRAAAGLVEFVDSVQRMDNSLRVATSSQEEFARAQQFLRKVSLETRTDMDGNATVYARLLRATQGLDLTSQDLELTMEGLTLATKVGGATAMEARNALIQFSQSLASGALRGDELRSVSEQLPALANAIGKEFGVAGGALIAFAKANPGILTTERVLKGVRAGVAQMREDFAKMAPTLSEGFIVMKTQLQIFLSDVQNATGILSMFGWALIGIANNLNIIIPLLLSFAGAFAIGYISQWIAAIYAANNLLIRYIVTGRLFIAVQTAINAVMMRNPLALFIIAIGAAIAGLVTLYQKSEAMRAILNPLFTAFSKVTEALGLIWGKIFEVVGAWEGFNVVTEAAGKIAGTLVFIFGTLFVGALAAFLVVTNLVIQGLASIGWVSQETATKFQKATDTAIEATGSMLGFGNAAKDTSDKTEGLGSLLGNLRAQYDQLTSGIDANTDALARNKNGVDALSETSARMIGHVEGFGVSMRSLSSELDQTAVSMWDSTAAGQKLRDSLLSTGDSADSASDSIGSVNDGLGTFLGIDGQVYNGLNGVASGYRNVASAANSAAAATRAANNAVSSGGGSSGGGRATPLGSISGLLSNAGKPLSTVISGRTGEVISGARAMGGPVTGGKTYLVGENGPELFTPSTDGGVTSNAEMEKMGQTEKFLRKQLADIDKGFADIQDWFKRGAPGMAVIWGHVNAKMLAMSAQKRQLQEFLAKIEVQKKIKERNRIKKELKNGFGDDGMINLPGFENVGPAPKIDFQTLTPWQSNGGGVSAPSSSSGYSGGGSAGNYGGSGGSSTVDNSIHVTMNITTQDAGSFRQNQAQIEGNMLAMVERAQRRKKRN